jgi:hypothetical protein
MPLDTVAYAKGSSIHWRGFQAHRLAGHMVLGRRCSGCSRDGIRLNSVCPEQQHGMFDQVRHAVIGWMQ